MIRKLFLTFFALLFLSLSPAFAEKKKDGEKKEEKEKPKEKIIPGIIASYGQMKGSAAVGTSSTGVEGEKAKSPISARISQGEDGVCQITVRNTSEKKSYSVRIKAVSTDEEGSSLGKKSFSSKLKPSASVDKKIKCSKSGGVQVSLKSGKEA